MQTITKTIHRPRRDSTDLVIPNYGLMALPAIDDNALGMYGQASLHLFQAEKEQKQRTAKTVLQSKKLKLINVIDINREFKRHDKGEIVEMELLSTLTGLCESNLRSACLEDDYHVDLDIEDGRCVLTGYHIHEINIDTSKLAHDERAVIYSALELVSNYLLPLMPPNWFLSSAYSIIGEIIDSGEFDNLASCAMKFESVEELVEFIESDESFEFLGYFLGQMDGSLCACVDALFDYELMYKECAAINKYQEDNGLNGHSNDTERLVKKHIKCLKKYHSSEAKRLLRVLKSLLISKLYTRFEAVEMDEAQPLDFTITIIDAPYRDLISHLQEEKYDELNQVGEPLREAISFDDSTLKRFNLLSHAFRELNHISNEKIK